MSETINIYCDESCHLENDHQKAMVLGAVWCPLDKTREIAVRLREIKQKHGLPPHFEVKWTKVSPAGKALYLDLVDYFFDDDDLHFRALLVPDKSLLRHDAFPGQDHDGWCRKTTWSFWRIAGITSCRGRPTWLNNRIGSGNYGRNTKNTGETKAQKAEAAPGDGFVTPSTHGR